MAEKAPVIKMLLPVYFEIRGPMERFISGFTFRSKSKNNGEGDFSRLTEGLILVAEAVQQQYEDRIEDLIGDPFKLDQALVPAIDGGRIYCMHSCGGVGHCLTDDDATASNLCEHCGESDTSWRPMFVIESPAAPTHLRST